MSTLVQAFIPSTIPIFKTHQQKKHNLHTTTNSSTNQHLCLIITRRKSFVALAVVADYGLTSHGRQRRGFMMVAGSYGHGSGSLRAVLLEKLKPELNKKPSKSVLGFQKMMNIRMDGLTSHDDDDEDDEDQDGWFQKRFTLDELYDMRYIEAVLQEWLMTLNDLPDDIRLACELGVIISAQLVKYLMNVARLSITRAIYRSLPKHISRAFMGRIMAVPAFLHKLLFEQFVTIACSVQSEFNRRGESGRSMQFSTQFSSWVIRKQPLCVANTRNEARMGFGTNKCSNHRCLLSLANTSRFNLHKLPNNIFEASYHHRRFDVRQRIQSFVCKTVQLSLVGFIAGGVQSALSNLCARNKQGSFPRPLHKLAISDGIRDGQIINRFDVIRVSLFFTATFRILNAKLGEISRNAWLDTENFAPLPRKAQRDKGNRKKRITRNKVPKNSLAS